LTYTHKKGEGEPPTASISMNSDPEISPEAGLGAEISFFEIFLDVDTTVELDAVELDVACSLKLFSGYAFGTDVMKGAGKSGRLKSEVRSLMLDIGTDGNIKGTPNVSL
jgi:hypothetical protein